ncbi:MAG: ABC transporter permease [Chitinophagaceae bacterium]|nr:ABC transporter permease [Chitinophagaceae bacterium]
MIKHYLRLAIRHLAKQKLLTVINIVGLSLGLACCILFMLYAVHELNYDRWHANADRLYRVNEVFMRDDVEQGMAGLYVPLGPAMKKEFPDVEDYVRIAPSGEQVVRVERQVTRIPVGYADAQLFGMFSFPLLSGDPATALKDPHSMVLTRDRAIQLFGSLDVVGRSIEVKKDSSYEVFTVTGVMENIPDNSSLHFDLLGSYEHLLAGERQTAINNWHMTFGDETYILLRKGSRLAAEQGRLLQFRHKYYQDEKDQGSKTRFGLQPIRELHTNARIDAGPPGTTTDPKNIWILLAIAGGIVLIASINFTTLAIARSAGRAREVGVRKVIGGRRSQLIGQFLTESVLLTVLSSVSGLLLAYVLLPWFNHLSGKELTLSFSRWPQLAWMLSGLILLVGLIAGSYPALVLSGFNAVAVLKNKIRLGGENFFTKGLVTFQFVLSIGLVIATLIILQQVAYMRSKDLGLVKENVIVVNTDDVDGKKIYSLLSQSLRTRPDVLGIGASQIGLGEGQGYMGGGYDFNGKKGGAIEYPVDTAFIKVLGMRLAAGRNFMSGRSMDTAGAVIVNEALVRRELGLTPEAAIGQQFKTMRGDFYKTIIGVVRDFNFEKLNRQVRAQLFFMPADLQPARIFIRLRAGDPSAAIGAMESAWKHSVPQLPFRYSFLDEDLGRWYKAETRWRDIVGWAGGISIFLACLGLFGLAALTAVNRVKEIGIRKILGASVIEIVQLLMGGFLRLVLLASLIASPLAWYFMNKWLQQWAYRIDIGWWVFAVTALAATGIAVLTIGVQAFKAANASPVKNLRTE